MSASLDRLLPSVLFSSSLLDHRGSEEEEEEEEEEDDLDRGRYDFHDDESKTQGASLLFSCMIEKISWLNHDRNH